MLGDNLDRTRAQLNGIRARKTKFICLNDDMRYPHPDIQVRLACVKVWVCGLCVIGGALWLWLNRR